jgi:hypothetical protein
VISDTDLRIYALGSLIPAHGDKVVPLLREIVLTSETGEARRALIVLAQSGREDAHATVMQVARTGPESIQLAAVRELGHIAGARIADTLLEVYGIATLPVKRQVVRSLGERADAGALVRIARTEVDRQLRDTAILTLGRTGARAELGTLYSRARTDMKLPIVRALFTAAADEELIAIVERESEAAVRAEAIARLRALGTPAARAYLARIKR